MLDEAWKDSGAPVPGSRRGDAMISIRVVRPAPTTAASHTLRELAHLIREACEAGAQYLTANALALLFTAEL